MIPDTSPVEIPPRLHRPRENCECASPVHSPDHNRSIGWQGRKFPEGFFRSLKSSLLYVSNPRQVFVARDYVATISSLETLKVVLMPLVLFCGPYEHNLELSLEMRAVRPGNVQT